MKKLICLLLVFIMISCTAAFAQVPSLSEGLFKYAKAALKCLAEGDYEKVVTSLPFSDVSPSAREWSSFAEGCFEGTSPQTKYAVAYWAGSVWKLAVPVSEPSTGGVDALVLISEDGNSFCGYGCSSWGSIEKEYRKSDYVFWNDEYSGSTSVVVELDED